MFTSSPVCRVACVSTLDSERNNGEETMSTQAEQIDAFAALLLEQHNARLRASGYQWDETVKVHPRKLYTLVDVGPDHNMSGRYMVEHATGVIYGIKGYGKVHKGHSYGTLDTVAEWCWGGYTARRVTA